MRRQVRPFLITSFSAALVRNSQARAAGGSSLRRCSKPGTEVHWRSTSSASVHFSFARPVAATVSSGATRILPDLAPVEPAPANAKACHGERARRNVCPRAREDGFMRGSVLALAGRWLGHHRMQHIDRYERAGCHEPARHRVSTPAAPAAARAVPRSGGGSAARVDGARAGGADGRDRG